MKFCRAETLYRSKYNLSLQNDVLKCANNFKSNDNMFTKLGNYL